MRFSMREARVTAEVLQSMTAYTAEDLAEHFGFDENDQRALATALAKLQAKVAAA